jgi:hypothetical protein
MPMKETNSGLVAQRPHATDNGIGFIGEVGMATEWFTPMNIAQVNLNKGKRDGCKGITKGNTGMREACRIDHKPLNFLNQGELNTVNELAFVIGLKVFKPQTKRVRKAYQLGIDALQSLRTVDVRFALTKHVEVRAME